MIDLSIRKQGWSTAYLKVDVIDFRNDIVYGVIHDLKTGEIRNDNFQAVLTNDWEIVLTANDVLEHV